MSVSLPGLDLSIEGTVQRVTDRSKLTRLAERYAAQGWPASVDGDSLTAEPYGATRWRFD